MNILDTVKNVPGGLLIIPMLISAIINTFCPNIVQIGDPTTAVFTSKGTMVLIGMILFISGSQLKLSEVMVTLKRGGVLTLIRIILGWCLGYLFITTFGVDGVWGISAVAFIATITSTNPGLYLALMNSYGDNVDRATFGILNILAVPILPLIILNSSSGVAIDYLGIVATFVPFLLGMLLGNVDTKIQEFFSVGTVILLPFLGISFGSYIDLMLAVQAGVSGILLTILFLVVCMLPVVYMDKLLLKRPGYSAAASCSVAGISLVVPTLAAKLNSIYVPFIQVAIAQIALAVIITSIIVPYITKAIVEISKKKSKKSADSYSISTS